MEKIRKELGPDAVILSSRHIRGKGIGGLFKKKLLEVVVAHEPVPERGLRTEYKPKPSPEPERPNIPPATDLTKIDQLNEKITVLQDVVKDFTEKIITVDKESTLKFSADVNEVYHRLLSHDVHDEVAKRIATATQDILGKTDEDPKSVAEQLILQALGDPAQIKLKKYKTNVIMLIGPTGVGKTTTLVKLAGLYTCACGYKVGLINCDTYRVAAQEQLKTYSEIMDIPLCTVYSPDDIPDALKTLQDRDVVLIDTAGKSSSDEEYRREIEELIAKSGADEVLLTMSIVTGFNASREIINNYSFLPEYKLIVTKMDEVSVWGNILNIITHSGKPLTYITVGQSVPDDIEQADMQKIADNILGSVSV